MGKLPRTHPDYVTKKGRKPKGIRTHGTSLRQQGKSPRQLRKAEEEAKKKAAEQ